MLLAAHAIEPDAAQSRAAEALQLLAKDLTAYRPASPYRLGVLWGANPPAAPRGLYLHGPVGGGKTMLMDLFFANVAFVSKRRLHFDAFMAEAHAAIEAERQRGLGDPMPGAAKALAARGLLLCLDEFQVNDIADAMILSRLFRGLFERGLVLVTTANIAPSELYRDGLNRSLFLPFINLLTQHTDVLEVAAARDFRLDKLRGRRLYFAPLGPAASQGLRAAWEMLTGDAAPRHRTLDVAGRRLDLPRTAGGTLWATFSQLCERPLGAADYRAIAATFHTLILEDIPALTADRRNEARRFTVLVDALYDARIRLIASAATEPNALYRAGDGSVAFDRTASRLVEMRSADYLEATGPVALHRPLVAD